MSEITVLGRLFQIVGEAWQNKVLTTVTDSKNQQNVAAV